jgi:S1-C subfamily serine protease
MNDESDGVLDAYSRAVTAVAQTVGPSVAALQLTRSAGSAVVFTDDGFLLTNAHVVGRDSNGTAAFADGTRRSFQVVGTDPLSDLAVVRCDGPTPTPAVLGEAGRLRVGQLVIAVGHPLGLLGSVTAGIVSGLGRALPVRAGPAVRVIDDVIQTDAALNPGNSGGALAIADGTVVGINTAIAGLGLGLAVPINAATRHIIGSLIHDGRVRRAYLGIAGAPAPVPPQVAQRIGRDKGVMVTETVPGGPARRAGMLPGDLILEAGHVPITAAADLQRLMLAEAIDQPFAMTVLRNGAMVDLIVRPAELTIER